MASITFKGIRFFAKKDNQPDFVLASGVITPAEVEQFCKDNAEHLSEYNGQKQFRIQLLKSRDGGLYIAVDTWKAGEAAPGPKVQVDQTPVPDLTNDNGERLPF